MRSGALLAGIGGRAPGAAEPAGRLGRRAGEPLGPRIASREPGEGQGLRGGARRCIGREGDLRLRDKPALRLCALVLCGISIAATTAAQTEPVQGARTDAAPAAAPEAALSATPAAQPRAAFGVNRTRADAVPATQESKVTDTGAEDAAQAVTVVEPEAPEARDDGPPVGRGAGRTAVKSDEQEARESGGGGIFSSILRWFQGRSADAAPEEEPAQTQARQPEREDDGREVTLSHAYRATLDLIAEVEVLRRATGVADTPGETVLPVDRVPIHAYVKSLEVMEKTARVQKRLGMIPIEVGPVPVKTITPPDIHRNVQTTLDELRRVKRQLVIEDEIEPAPFAGGKTPSLLYKNLGDASLLLDGLVGRPTTSNDVYLHILRIHDAMALIAERLGVALESDPPAVDGRKEPKDVAQQILRATYKVIALQSRLGMDASAIPTLTLARITPAEVYDSTNILMAEMVRIKMHLDIRELRAVRHESRSRQSKDVFAQAQLIIRNLDTLARAAADTT